jgi:hypothetical protein
VFSWHEWKNRLCLDCTWFCLVAHGTLYLRWLIIVLPQRLSLCQTLYLSTSPAEYYDWEDAMKDFLRDRGLESRIKILFAKITFLSKFCNDG